MSSTNTTELLQRLAHGLDRILNGDRRGTDRENGFVLLTFPFGGAEGARVNYVSNASRAEIVASLKEIVARFEGRAHDAPRGKQ